jgi:hypothetical protein
VRLWIEDNGIGIDASYHRKIFSMFERVGDLHRYEGTGIGLAIVHRAVQRMGGACGVESAPGQGSRFWVDLLSVPPSRALTILRAMISSEQPIIILLVEDSPDDVFFFRRAVHKSGLSAVTHVAVDGVEAMDYLLNKGRFADAAAYPPPDIMFLDLKLPHVNGFEVLEWMRRHAECPRRPWWCY